MSLDKIVEDLGRIKDYLTAAQAEIQALTVQPGPDPDPDPDLEPAAWSMHGKPLPTRPYPELHDGPRSGAYAKVMVGTTESNLICYGATSACLTMAGGAIARNIVCFNSGADAVKWLWGDITIEDGHFFGLGKTEGAHADGVQGRGPCGIGIFRRIFFDQPNNRLSVDGSRSNSCWLGDNALGDGGEAFFEECIFRGGNTVLMAAQKGTSTHALPKMHLTRCTFVVERDSPRFTLVMAQGEYTYEDCEVVYHNEDTGLCELIYQGDPRQFDAKAWHVAKFGEEPIH